MSQQLGRRVSDVNLHEIVRELANHEVRIDNTEKILREQTNVLRSIEKKFTWGGGVLATLVFLNTPIGISLWSVITG
jgi:hypothetical protein